jgi:hypothetical protein
VLVWGAWVFLELFLLFVLACVMRAAGFNTAADTKFQLKKPNSNQTATPKQHLRYMGHLKIDLESKKLKAARPVLLGGPNSTSPWQMVGGCVLCFACCCGFGFSAWLAGL